MKPIKLGDEVEPTDAEKVERSIDLLKRITEQELRDVFAGQAMAALVHANRNVGQLFATTATVTPQIVDLARTAYSIAQAMMEERDERMIDEEE